MIINGFMEIGRELNYIVELLSVLSFLVGFLSGYLYVEHRNEHRLNKANEEIYKQEEVYQN